MKYHNIAVSGKVCTGTTTLCRLLKKKLGWEHWDAGTFFRQYCEEHSIALENTKLRSDELRREVDFSVRKRLQTKKHLLHEGWLSGFFAQNVKGVLKVLLVCDDSLRIDRLVNRDKLTVEEAKKHIYKREAENALAWKKAYHKEWQKWVRLEEVDFWNPGLYDLVIDTFSNSRQETLKKVLKILKN